MSSERMHVIALNQATDAHREAVQAIVKVHATGGWWHNFADLWIVGGRDVIYWRDLIKPTLALSPAQVLVMRLPDDNARGWATAGVPEPKFRWLRAVYAKRLRDATARTSPPVAIPTQPTRKVRLNPPAASDDEIPF